MGWSLGSPGAETGRGGAVASAFEQLVLPHLGSAYNLARWLVRDPVMAQDVVQEAMLRAWRHQAGLRGEAKGWLLQIVRNVAYAMHADQQRAPAPVDPASLADLPELGYGPDDLLQHKQGLDRLQRAIAALPPDLRECLVLREFEELSYKEIAGVTGVPIGTVMSRLSRARRALLDGAPK